MSFAVPRLGGAPRGPRAVVRDGPVASGSRRASCCASQESAFERPAVAEDDRPTASPVLVVDLRTVGSRDESHDRFPSPGAGHGWRNPPTHQPTISRPGRTRESRNPCSSPRSATPGQEAVDGGEPRPGRGPRSPRRSGPAAGRRNAQPSSLALGSTMSSTRPPVGGCRGSRRTCPRRASRVDQGGHRGRVELELLAQPARAFRGDALPGRRRAS